MTLLEFNNILSPIINLFLCIGLFVAVTAQQKFNKFISEILLMDQRLSFLEKKLNDKC